MGKPFHIHPFVLRWFCLLLLFVLANQASAQITKVSGQVVDIETGEGLSFVNVIFQNSTVGTITDLDGYYNIETSYPTDTLVASFVGYDVMKMPVVKQTKQKINFNMKSSTFEMEAVVVKPGENPAHPILRNIIANKDNNNKEKLNYYQYEVYNKVQFDINNITEKFENRKVFKPFKFVFDNIDTSEVNGKRYLPTFITESLSDVYYRKRPKSQKEYIKATQASGVDNESVGQFLGDMYQNINIYDNFILIIGKSFVSPIANFGKQYYKYYLEDSTHIGQHWAYKIRFLPKLKQEPTFYGEFWVADSTWAILKVDMRVSEQANINWVQDAVVYQEYDFVADSAWMLTKDRLVVDFAVGENGMGLYGTKTTTYRDFKINEPKPDEFYSGVQNIILGDNVDEKPDEFWEQHRHEGLSKKEASIYHIADTIQTLPAFKTWYDIVKLVVSGHYAIGKFDYGPVYTTYSFNQIEGHRIRLGGRTNNDLSTKVRLEGYGAYGFRDQRFKYGGGVLIFLSKKPRQLIDAHCEYDMEQLGQSQNAFREDNLFASFFRRRPFTKLSRVMDVSGSYTFEWFPGFSHKIGFVHREISPADTNFIAYKYTDDSFKDNEIITSEARFETRFAFDEKFIDGDLNRLSLGTKWPVLQFRYSYGLKGLWDGQFEYHKFDFSVDDWFKVAPVGYISYIITAGKTWGTLPFPLLFLHQGNETYTYDSYAYNMMNYIEFVSDEFASLSVQWHLNGYLLNKIPLMRKLRLREVASAKVLTGRMVQDTRSVMEFSEELYTFDNGKPYMEVGVGIENILNIFRIDLVWRLSYLNHPNIEQIGIRGNFYFNF